jgi:RNA polymerase sigma-70 factor (ECF subfamily)
LLEGVIQGLQASKPTMREPGTASRPISPQAFDELFLSTYPSIVAILRRMLGDCGRAEELANEAFLRLYSTALPPAAKENVPGWLYRTAMNLGIDDLRARVRHNRVEREAAHSVASDSHPEDALQLLLRAEKQQRVRMVLAKLKPQWAQLLLLRASGHSYRELAEHLELAPGSVGTMLIRAEASFEKCYLELFGEKDSEAL